MRPYFEPAVVRRQRERLGALASCSAMLLLAYLVYRLSRPFLAPLAWAAVLAIAFSPRRVIEQTATLVTARVSSTMIVASLRGVAGGLTFWLLGLPASVFWGAVTAVFSVLPFDHRRGRVSTIDNVLRPLRPSGRSQMNGLLR